MAGEDGAARAAAAPAATALHDEGDGVLSVLPGARRRRAGAVRGRVRPALRPGDPERHAAPARAAGLRRRPGRCPTSTASRAGSPARRRAPGPPLLLDVPCGGGTLLPLLREQGFTGVRHRERPRRGDAAPRGAAARPPRRRRDRAAARRRAGPAVRDGAVDGAVSLNGLHCMPDPQRFVRELARVVRPGGRLFLITLVSGGTRRADLSILAGRLTGIIPTAAAAAGDAAAAGCARRAGGTSSRSAARGCSGVEATRTVSARRSPPRSSPSPPRSPSRGSPSPPPSRPAGAATRASTRRCTATPATTARSARVAFGQRDLRMVLVVRGAPAPARPAALCLVLASRGRLCVVPGRARRRTCVHPRCGRGAVHPGRRVAAATAAHSARRSRRARSACRSARCAGRSRRAGDRAPDRGSLRTRGAVVGQPHCFGAAAPRPARPCRNPALRRRVFPRPLDAFVWDNAPCRGCRDAARRRSSRASSA